MTTADRGAPSTCLDEGEIRILKSLLGDTILSVDGQEGGVVESAYLRLADSIIELAAVWVPRSVWFYTVGFPWRISPRVWDLGTVFSSPLLTDIADVGTVTAIDVYADDGDVEVALALRLANERTLWVTCAGGDHVAPSLDKNNEVWHATKVSRTL